MSEKANYEPPASQVDLEERLAKGNASSRILTTSDQYAERLASGEYDATDGREFRVEGNDTDAYQGVGREYMTYANDTEKPLVAEEGPEAEVEEAAAERGDLVKDHTVAESKPDKSEEAKAQEASQENSSPGAPQAPSSTAKPPKQTSGS